MLIRGAASYDIKGAVPRQPAEPSVTHSVVALIKVASNATIVLMSRALEEVAREAIELSKKNDWSLHAFC